MTFTESDAENDGLIKREVGKQMAKVAKTQNPEVFEHFQNVCDEVGRSPADVFGEMAVRALDSEHYSDQILSAEVNMKKIMADDIRLEDVKYVKQLSEELGLNETEQKEDPIDALINQRIENVGRSPIENISKSREDPSGVDGQVLEHMESLQQEINSLRSKIDSDEQSRETGNQTTQRNEQSVDDLFGGSDDTEEVVEEEQETTGEVVEVEPEPEPEPVDETETVEEEGPTEEELMEAMGGTVESVDEVPDETEPEELDEEIDIPSEQEDEKPFFASEDGEEE